MAWSTHFIFFGEYVMKNVNHNTTDSATTPHDIEFKRHLIKFKMNIHKCLTNAPIGWSK